MTSRLVIHFSCIHDGAKAVKGRLLGLHTRTTASREGVIEKKKGAGPPRVKIITVATCFFNLKSAHLRRISRVVNERSTLAASAPQDAVSRTAGRRTVRVGETQGRKVQKLNARQWQRSPQRLPKRVTHFDRRRLSERVYVGQWVAPERVLAARTLVAPSSSANRSTYENSDI
jgi:hypothetical protein